MGSARKEKQRMSDSYVHVATVKYNTVGCSLNLKQGKLLVHIGTLSYDAELYTQPKIHRGVGETRFKGMAFIFTARLSDMLQ